RVQFNEFPLAVHGDIGVLTHLQPINEPELLQHWDSNGGRGVFTFSTWIYLERSCDSSWCNILLGIDAENRHRSPGLLITKDNRLHYQGHHSNRKTRRDPPSSVAIGFPCGLGCGLCWSGSRT
uniref:ALK tyrosine kinase receptor n=1 Tax=Macrostomum lignano TaxID=282301 RepID=A0A1I8G148_9PLAT